MFKTDSTTQHLELFPNYRLKTIQFLFKCCQVFILLLLLILLFELTLYSSINLIDNKQRTEEIIKCNKMKSKSIEQHVHCFNNHVFRLIIWLLPSIGNDETEGKLYLTTVIHYLSKYTSLPSYQIYALIIAIYGVFLLMCHAICKRIFKFIENYFND